MIYIRADANEIIGTGHVMRCLSIAKEARRIGRNVVFIYADERTKAIVEQQGFGGICLNSVWNDLEQEVNKMINLIHDRNIDFLLIDSYYVTEHYLSTLREKTKIGYIDDLHEMIYPSDLLVNYNLYAVQYDYETEYAQNNTELLLGTEYAPLREEFCNVTRNIFDVAKKILITSGGTDQYNVVGNLLSEFEKTRWFAEYEYYVVLGRFNKHISELKNKFQMYGNIYFLENISNISYYMQLCDLAITAGGVTTYELCACGIPSIMYTIADNQLQVAQIVSDKKLMSWVGDVRDNMDACIKKIITEVESLSKNVLLRRKISGEMQNLVDGKGCKRLADAIEKII